ncbi:unnamed protein product [Candida verbasci]|uniref:NAD(+) diphosphatase n=1 Tax=Candida verbasci TaxID=1227364 RepID=A0A9W4U0X8_9ASCO|nr:unnamed protein product [Candida verbasci]
MSHSIHSSIKDLQKDIYFGTEFLNRISFLREDNEFICKSLLHPSTRFIFFNKQQPLIHKKYDNKLTILTNENNQFNVKEITNEEKTISISLGLKNLKGWDDILQRFINDNKNQNKDIRDDKKPVFLFMGLLDESTGLNLKELKMENSECENFLDYQGRYQGIAYYAVDLTPNKELQSEILNFISGQIQGELFFTYSRKHYLSFNSKEAALFSHASMYFDWLNKNRYCVGCGSKMIPIHAGGKLQCTNEEKKSEDYICKVKNATVSNVCFPRTDMVIITIVVNKDRSKILLSLNKRYEITKMYTCTAGFMEPSETVEVATKREIWEETGVLSSSINIKMTQPWPFPANLMIGCLAEVEFNNKNEIIHLGHDNELSDARWFDVDFVRKLVYPNEAKDEDWNPEEIIIPMPESIAFQLIKLAVDEAKEFEEKRNVNKL